MMWKDIRFDVFKRVNELLTRTMCGLLVVHRMSWRPKGGIEPRLYAEGG